MKQDYVHMFPFIFTTIKYFAAFHINVEEGKENYQSFSCCNLL